MTRDDDVWAPPAEAPPADPYATYPRYPLGVVWPPDAPAQARAAVLKAWLERRFPDGGTSDERDRRGRRKLWVSALLSGLVLAAIVVALARYGVPHAPSSADQPWWPWLFGSLLLAWAGFGAALFLATRPRPTVFKAEREVLARLTASEHRDLRADFRTPPSPDADHSDADHSDADHPDADHPDADHPDADHLDVVAAAWLGERGHVLLTGFQVLFALSFAASWQPNPLTLLPVMTALLLGKQLIEDVRDLLAARAWLAARGRLGRRV